MFLTDKETVTEITELIQPVSVSPSTNLFEGGNINEYPVTFFFGTFTCLIFACAQTSHGANFPVNSIFMYFAVGLSKCSPVCPDLVEFPHGNLLSWFN